jgi:hypothetical protein|tara:strand:+ start:795 stop:905 length:111 start_codon:yes stop_codon:yes gene_type:complete
MGHENILEIEQAENTSIVILSLSTLGGTTTRGIAIH